MRRPLLAFALVVLAAGCARCGKAPAAAPGSARVERYLPKDVVGAVVVPSAQQLGEKLKLLQQLKAAAFAAQLQGEESAQAFGDALVAELGVDVRSAAAMEKAGLEPSGGLAVGVLASADAYLVLPVKDSGRLEQTLKGLAARRLGAAVAGEERAGAVTVKTFAVAPGQPPRLGFALVGRFALVAATPGGVAHLAALAALPEQDSLAADEALAARLAAMPAPRDGWAWLPPGSPVIAHLPISSALLTVSLSRAALVLDASVEWRGPEAQLAALAKGPGPDLLGVLPRDAVLVARFSGDAKALGPHLADLLGPSLTRAFREGGLDVEAEVLANLQPGAVASLSLSPKPPLSRGMPTLDLRRTNPFAYVHLAGAGAVRNQDAAAATLEKVASLAPRFGAQMKKQERAGHSAFATSYSEGEGVHFAQVGERVLFGAPMARLDALLAADGQGGSPVTGLGDEAVALSLDLARLGDAVRNLPDDAWGLGGFAMKASTVRWLDAVQDVTGVSAGVSARGRSVRATVKVSLNLGDGKVE